MKIAICDNDIIYHKYLIDCYKKYFDESISFISYKTEKSLLENSDKIKTTNILFLNISNNFKEICKELRLVNSDIYIIVMTYNSSYAIKGYELKVNDFLLKPIKEKTLYNIYKRAFSLLEHRRIILKTKEGKEIVNLRDIAYIESFGRKLIIGTINKSYEVYGKLSEKEKELKKFGFIRVHRSYIVNQYFADHISKGFLILKNKKEIPISRNKYKILKDLYTNKTI